MTLPVSSLTAHPANIESIIIRASEAIKYLMVVLLMVRLKENYTVMTVSMNTSSHYGKNLLYYSQGISVEPCIDRKML